MGIYDRAQFDENSQKASYLSANSVAQTMKDPCPTNICVTLSGINECAGSPWPSSLPSEATLTISGGDRDPCSFYATVGDWQFDVYRWPIGSHHGNPDGSWRVDIYHDPGGGADEVVAFCYVDTVVNGDYGDTFNNEMEIGDCGFRCALACTNCPSGGDAQGHSGSVVITRGSCP
jgi:hypothetical protein